MRKRAKRSKVKKEEYTHELGRELSFFSNRAREEAWKMRSK